MSRSFLNYIIDRGSTPLVWRPPNWATRAHETAATFDFYKNASEQYAQIETLEWLPVPTFDWVLS